MENITISADLAKDLATVIHTASQRNAFRLEEYAAIHQVYQNLITAINKSNEKKEVVSNSDSYGE